MSLRFPQTVRLDASDERVFERAATPGEWAISGAFAFADVDPAELKGKARQAFANGFLGTESFGFATFVMVKEISPLAYEGVIAVLSRHFVDRYGAPDLAHALPAARAEAEFAVSLCEHPVNTLLCVRRQFGEQGITEQFRIVEPPREAAHTRIWEIVPDE